MDKIRKAAGPEIHKNESQVSGNDSYRDGRSEKLIAENKSSKQDRLDLENNARLAAAVALKEGTLSHPPSLSHPQPTVCTVGNLSGQSTTPIADGTKLVPAYGPTAEEKIQIERTEKMLDAVGNYIKDKLNPFTDEAKLGYELWNIDNDARKKLESTRTESNRNITP